MSATRQLVSLSAFQCSCFHRNDLKSLEDQEEVVSINFDISVHFSRREDTKNIARVVVGFYYIDEAVLMYTNKNSDTTVIERTFQDELVPSSANTLAVIGTL